MAPTVDVFISYAQADSELRAELVRHLAPLERQRFIRTWDRTRLQAGDELHLSIKERLAASRVVLLLISAAYLDSDDLHDNELQPARLRASAGQAHVIPIIVRACDWEASSFADLLVLPRDKIPVTSRDDHDAVWRDIVHALREHVAGLEEARTVNDVPTRDSDARGPQDQVRAKGWRWRIAQVLWTLLSAAVFTGIVLFVGDTFVSCRKDVCSYTGAACSEQEVLLHKCKRSNDSITCLRLARDAYVDTSFDRAQEYYELACTSGTDGSACLEYMKHCSADVWRPLRNCRPERNLRAACAQGSAEGCVRLAYYHKSRGQQAEAEFALEKCGAKRCREVIESWRTQLEDGGK